MNFVTLQGRRIEYESIRVADRAPTIVFLHEGLGSIALWRDFPSRVAHATGCNALVYSRQGYGGSDPPDSPRLPDYLHREALTALPALLDILDIEAPILLGHSDGASIALIHGADAPEPPRGIVAMAPHVKVEDISIAGIEAAVEAYRTTDWRARLARYHADPDGVFRSWSGIWLDPAFRAWSIEDCLPRIRCPVLAIQGEDDEYGTMAQIDRIAELAPDVELLKLTDCRHSPHRDQPDAVIAAVVRFVDRIREGSG